MNNPDYLPRDDDFLTDVPPEDEPVAGEATENEVDERDEDTADVIPATDEEEGYDEDDPAVDHAIYGDPESTEG